MIKKKQKKKGRKEKEEEKEERHPHISCIFLKLFGCRGGLPRLPIFVCYSTLRLSHRVTIRRRNLERYLMLRDGAR